jgi:hypothetical protein
MNKCNLKTTMKKFTKLLCFLFVSFFITQLSFSQTTEDFETETIGGTTFSDNGQNFAITNGPGESTYDVETFASGGWNGTAPDNRFLDNSGAGGAGAPLNDGTSFTISTSDGANILVNNLYLFLSTRTLQVASSTLTITGRRDGATVYTIVKSTGFSSPVTFTPNNGFTLIDFSTEGGSDNSNTAVDELIFSTTGNGDYAALDGINWEAIACTDPSVPSLTASANPICAGGSTTLDWAGTSAGDATNWVVYTGTCGTGTQVASLPIGTTSYNTGALASNTTFFVRGEGGCITPGACGSIAITVNPVDNASFNYSVASYCQDAADPSPTVTLGGGIFSGTAGLSINAGTGVIDVSTSSPGLHTVTYLTTGPCPSSSNVNVTINALPSVTFTTLNDLCIDAGNQTGLGGGLPTGGVYSGPGVTDAGNGTNYSYDPATAGAGVHTITYNFTDGNGCSGSASDFVETFFLPSVTFTAPMDLCLDAGNQTGLGGGLPTGGVYSGTGVTDAGNGTNYSFNPAVAGVGAHTITYTFTDGNSCSGSANDNIVVFALPTVTFFAPTDLCLDAGNQTGLTGGAPTGGVYSGTGVMDAGDGIIYSLNLIAAGVGTTTITYNLTDGNSCSGSANDNIEIFALPTVTFTALNDICLNAGVQSGQTGGSPTGGVYSGPGVTDAGDGINYSFDPALAALGVHTITYNFTDGNGCSGSASDFVETFFVQPVTFTAPMDLCLDAGNQIGLGGGLQTGGVYSGTGVTDAGNGTNYSFDPAAAGVGTHTITYTFTDGNSCTESANDNIVVFGLPTVSFTAPTDLCLDAGNQAGLGGGLPTGGVYSGTGVTDAGNGTNYSFDPAAAGVGAHTITYNFTDGNSCSGSANDNIVVFGLPTVTFTTLNDLCLDAGTQTGLGGGLPTGGVYSGPGVMDAGNGTNYSFDPAAAGVGIHTITYNFTDGNSCSGSANDNVEVLGLDNASFTYGAAGYCLGDSDPTPTITGLGGGTFTALPAGLNINPTTGFINIGLSIPNTYTVTYTTAGTCPNTSNVPVVIGTPPASPSVVSPMTVCPGDDVILSATGSGTGSLIFYNNIPAPVGTVPMPPATGTLNVGALPVGPYSFGVTESNGTCQSLPTAILVTVGDAIAPTAICQNINVYLDAAGTASIVASDIDGGSTDNCGTVNLSASQLAFTCADVASPFGELIITAVYDATLTGGTPKGVELYVANDIADLSLYGISSAGNGSGTTVTPEFTFPAVSATAGQYIYVASESVQFNNWFGFAPDYTTTSMLINGDDAIELFAMGAIIDVFGDVNVDGTGQPWDHLDGWAYRNSSTGPDGTTFQLGSWSFSGVNVLDGETSNATAATPIPIGTFTPQLVASPTSVTLTVNDGNGNSDDCVSQVSVLDTISPTISCPANQIEFATATCDFTLIDYTAMATAADNCATVLVSQSPAVGTVISATTTITLTATDGSGNTSACTFDVSLNDTISPTAVCQNINVYLDGTGSASIVAGDIDGGSTDNCGAVTLAADITAFTCADLGANSVTLTVTDGNTNTAICTSTVTVLDTISPTASCQDITVFLDATGNVTFSASDLDNGSGDNCGTAILSANTTAFTCANVGANTVTLTVDDGNGNTATCTSTVTVSDTISPTASCQNITVFLDVAGTASIVATDIDNGSTDICGAVTYAADITSFTCADVGANTVVLTVTDVNGNTNTCTSTVTVSDTISPTASCQDITVFLDAAGTVSIAATDIDNGSGDNCSLGSLSITPSAFTCANVGSNTVTLTVTDVNGNTATCTSTVTVSDTISPTASCQDITVFLDAAGTVSIVAGDIDNGSGDNCSLGSLSITPSTFTCAEVGANTVTLTVTDVNGNTSTCTSTVTVSDTISPIASCQDITVFLDGTGNVSFTAADIDNGSTDNCTTVTLASDFTSFTCADVGPNTVVLTVTDASGNTSTCTSTVTVSDTISPTASCQDITVFLDGTGNVTFTAADIDNGSTDNCTTVTLASDFTSFTCAEVGPNTVVLTITDASGNTSTCTSTVTVSDTISPTASCQDITVFLDAAGTVSIVASDIDNGSTDNCTAVTLAADVTSFTCAEVGPNTVILTVTDASGNTSTCTSTVTVSDTISPTITCPGDVVVNNDPGVCSATGVVLGTPTTADNCSVASTTDNGLVTYPVGVTNVIWTVTDANGNTSTCTQTVTVVDNEAPVLPIILDVNVECGVTIPVPTATDNCAGTVLGFTTDPLNYTVQGIYVINWTFDDGNGNVVPFAQNVIVDDVTAPLVVIPLADVTDECSVTLTAPAIADNCAGLVTGTTTTTFPITTQGTTVVTWMYDDGNGNVSSQNQNVIIDDVTLPLVDVATLTDVTAECEVTTLTPPTAMDNCSGALVGTSTVTLPITAQGTTVVTWMYDDGNGNITLQDQNVIITDVTAPVPDVASLATVTGECDAVVTAPTATDACGGIVVIGTTTDPVSYTAQGTYTVTWTYTDANGNSDTQTQTVIVDDVTAPVEDVASLADVTGLCSVTLTAPTATDNCNGTITGTTTTVFPVTATTTVTWTYIDGNGNTSTQDQDVIITGVDVTTTTLVGGVEISANNASGDSYQWIDCNNGNAPVGSGTSQNYIATANGSYAVIINENGCIDTSACVTIGAVGIDDIVKEDFNIYPNPVVGGTFTVTFDGEIKNIELQDLQGRLIKVLYSTSTGEVNVSDLARGKYFVRVTTGTDQVLVKSIIIIQ